MLLYNLPRNWTDWTHTEKLEWHAERVDAEEPVFEELARAGVMSCFEPHEIRARLSRLQGFRKLVESALELATNEEFVGLNSALQEAAKTALENKRERVKILTVQSRRVRMNKTPDEVERLAYLRTSQEHWMQESIRLESELIRLCDKLGVSPDPYLVVEFLRS